jgi:hypothetical protein
MQGQVNVGGSWNHAAKTILAKITDGSGSSWRNVNSGWVKVGGAWRQWFKASFIDTFTRTTSATSLGSPNGTQTWSNIRGAWGIISNKATANSAANTYPMATITFDSADVTIAQDNVTNGVGAAFWVTDANNWWATSTNVVESYQTAYVDASSNYGTCYVAGSTNYGPCYVAGNANYGPCYVPGNPNYGYYYYAGNANYGPCPTTVTNYYYGCTAPSAVYGTCTNTAYNYQTYGGGSYLYTVHVNANSYTCLLYYTQYCSANPYTYTTYYTCQTGDNSTSNFGVTGNNGYTTTCQNGDNSYTYTCAKGDNSYTYTCATGSNAAYTYNYNYSYAYSVKLIQSIANVVSTITTFTFGSLVVGLKTIVKGSTGAITVRGYSTPGFGTQIGVDQTYTATGYTSTTTHGMILAPANYNQGTNLSSYELDYYTL